MHNPAARSVGGQRSALKITVEVNHIVVPAKDEWASARLLAYVLGLEVEPEPDHLARVRTGDGLTLDFSAEKSLWPIQCALLVNNAEFDAAFERIKSGTIRFYAEVDGTGRGEINRLHGGRGVYFDDPNGHVFELIEQVDSPASERRIKAVAIKLSPARKA